MGKRSKTPAEKIKKAVERHLAGEPAAALAKEYGVSRPGFYLWVKKYKAEITAKAMRANMTAPNIEKAQKRDLKMQNTALIREVKDLKQRLFELMLETGRI